MVRRQTAKKKKNNEWPCGHCRKNCDSSCVLCGVCDQWFHCNCENVSSDKLKLISNNPEDYICVSCRSEDGKFDFLMGMERLKQIIRWPPPQRQVEIATAVEVSSLPGMIGFIDGSHIRLSAALEGEKDYYNRKGYPSMQLQIVVDKKLKILNAYTGWPGCVHDARVLWNSSLFTKAEAGELFSQDHHIFGDNANPLRNWLTTPFKNFQLVT